MSRAWLRHGTAGVGMAAAFSVGFVPAAPAQAQESVPCDDIPALKAAINRANTGDGVIVLAPGCTYRLTGADRGEDGLPPITGNVRISSSNSTITRSSFWPFRILHIAAGGALTLERTTVSGGWATGGGGIYNESGALTLIDVTVEKSVALGHGGGIGNVGGTVTMRRGYLRDNRALRDGGGLHNRVTGAVTLNGVSITGNTSGGRGGGVDNQGTSAMSLIGATISGNRAERGGGLHNQDSAVTVLGGLITGNTATAAAGGGGIFSAGGKAEVASGRVTGNTPDDCAPGGAVNGCPATAG